jgi:hypothetical protein
MPSPEARDEHVVDALLDAGALLQDPMRMAVVLDELRTHRAEPGPELAIAVAARLTAGKTKPRRARPPRRLVLATGALAAACAVAVVGAVALTSPGSSPQASFPNASAPSSQQGSATGEVGAKQRADYGAAGTGTFGTAKLPAAATQHVLALPASSRLQDYQAWMRLRVTSTTRLSQVTQRAISLTRGFGGYVTLSNVSVQGARSGTSTVDVHIPVGRVQEAIARFSSLGVIVGQHVAVADLQAGYDQTSSRIESLRHSLALIGVRLADPKVTPEQRVALLAQREHARHALAGATRTSSDLAARGAYARVDLSFATGAKAAPVVHKKAGRLEHAIRRAGGMLETVAIGALFVAIIGLPVVALVALVLFGARTRRRRGERALLERT